MCTIDGACFYPESRKASCPICKRPVSLERCKTDEDGRAIHEDCYVRKICSGVMIGTVNVRSESLR
jgi:hypothetical protein